MRDACRKDVRLAKPAGAGGGFRERQVEVVAEIIELDVAIDHQAFGHVLQSGHAQPEVPLRIGDRKLLARLLLAVLRDIFPG